MPMTTRPLPCSLDADRLVHRWSVAGRDRGRDLRRSLDPSTGGPWPRSPTAQPDDAVAALDAAVAAQPGWAATAPRERGEVLHRAWQLMTERVDDLALLMTLEMGKSLAESRAEVSYAAEFFRWFAEQAVRIDGRFSRDPRTPTAAC